MDPVQKIWMYENWIADQKEEAEFAKNSVYLLASFSNPEAVKQILGEGNTHKSTDEEFEETSKMVEEINKANQQQVNNQQSHSKRKRRILQKS